MVVIYEYTTVTTVASVGISHSMEQNVRNPWLLMGPSTCLKEQEEEIFIVTVTLKVTATKFPREMLALESGLEIAKAMEMLMRTLVGTLCPVL
jgi:hypothetical protein